MDEFAKNQPTTLPPAETVPDAMLLMPPKPESEEARSHKRSMLPKSGKPVRTHPRTQPKNERPKPVQAKAQSQGVR
ncbi:hypothetical protein H2514_03135 [Lysobacter sp. CW239]|uniref:hypothetical protein n=1 Tax=Lysobacteraceae TaxID=32033 RepID=UPI0017464C8C|nr:MULTISPECIES: hypothetical protein [Lysobacter]QOD91659.1 hypothetical protein H2514_03135 [Lysobacter sp. CW239]